MIWFDNRFYVELKDSSGASASEVIVDPTSGAVSTEPGPAMMWNTRYTMETTTAQGTVDGMLSVNATTGQVWYHTWHGRFIAREDS